MSPQLTSLGIVVGVDGSAPSIAAVEWAAREAEMRNLALKLVYVSPPIPAFSEPLPPATVPVEYSAAQEDFEHHLLEKACKIAVEASPGRGSHVSSEALFGPIIPTLVDLSSRAEMIVVGSSGQGAVARAVLGSVSSDLIRRAQCPVAVIHHDEALAISPQAPVVVGIDGSPASALATEIAFDEASRRGVDLVALHAWDDMGALEFGRPGRAPIEWANFDAREEEVLAERLSGWQERYPDVVVHKVVVSDRPKPRLLEQAEKAQLLVVGSHGRGGFTGMLLGSVSRGVVHAARIPVIVARTPQHH